jgi:LysM repeat protein
VPWALIAEANEILPPDYVIQVGQTLVIPLPGESPEGPPTYVVQPGDTITGIAFELGVDPTELADLNELENWDEIYAGQVLLVPGDWQQQESPAP